MATLIIPNLLRLAHQCCFASNHICYLGILETSTVDTHSVTCLLNLLREGDEGAANEVWKRFFELLSAIAEQLLRDSPVRMVDGEDVALDVMQSLCRRVKADEFPNLNDRDGLWRLLLTMTGNKARNQIRHEMAQKRGSGKTRGESVFRHSENAESKDGGLDNIASVEPTPEFVAAMNETLTESLGKLTDEQRTIVVLRMQGYSNREVSEQVETSVATVERRLRQVRATWNSID